MSTTTPPTSNVVRSYVSPGDGYVSNAGSTFRTQASVIPLDNGFSKLRDAAQGPAMENSIQLWSVLPQQDQHIQASNEQKLSLIDNIQQLTFSNPIMDEHDIDHDGNPIQHDLPGTSSTPPGRDEIPPGQGQTTHDVNGITVLDAGGSDSTSKAAQIANTIFTPIGNFAETIYPFGVQAKATYDAAAAAAADPTEYPEAAFQLMKLQEMEQEYLRDQASQGNRVAQTFAGATNDKIANYFGLTLH